MGISIIKTVELHPIIYILHKGYINFHDDSFSLRKKHNKSKAAGVESFSTHWEASARFAVKRKVYAVCPHMSNNW